jgi:hypothetical protein
MSESEDEFFEVLAFSLESKWAAKGTGWQLMQAIPGVYEFILDWDAPPEATWEASSWFFSQQMDVEVIGTRAQNGEERWITTVIVKE